jgi:phosphoglycerol transferase MdoB-like AlkP superfamily enzyme
LKFRSFIPQHIQVIATFFFVQLAIFSTIRLILVTINIKELLNDPVLVILESLWIGIRFDSVIGGYVLIFPFLVLFIAWFFPKRMPWLTQGVIAVTILLSGFSTLLCLINIPYFDHFHTPLTISLLDWMDQPWFIFRMVFSTVSFYPYILLFLLLIFGYVVLFQKLKREFTQQEAGDITNETWKSVVRSILFSLCAFVLIVITMRGRIAEKSPIRWGTAYSSQYQLPNQLALNPVFTFMQSWIERSQSQGLRLIEDEQAIRNVRHYLNISETKKYASPIARFVPAAGTQTHQNVVLVLMESMASWKMGTNGRPYSLTPFLDSLSLHATSLDQFYSDGTHTYNGIYSSLFGMPALLARHPMKLTESIQPFTGIAHTLGSNGYQTIYFCTHDAEFDNMAGFLSNNGFQQIVSEKDYPASEVKSTLGVPDHILFDEAIPRISKLAAERKPFFAAFLTASDHIPYVFPTDIDFHPRTSAPNTQIVEYADWSIRQFIKNASRQEWYHNTIFIFIADHGAATDSKFGLTLSAHSSPCIIFSPGSAQPGRSFHALATQLDIYPTIMGMLNISFVNNTLGIDIFQERRPFICFNSDEVTGCMDNEYYLVRRGDGQECLYHYRRSDPTDYRSQNSALADSMSIYMRSMYQTAQWIVQKRLAGEQR